MGQEFVIKSQDIEDKINQLLPSQGGFQPGVDFSASTTIIPIVDLTETAEGSALRSDLQTANGFETTLYESNGSVVQVANTTGYWKLNINFSISGADSNTRGIIYLEEGATTKTIWQHRVLTAGNNGIYGVTDRLVTFLSAGKVLKIQANNSACNLSVTARQIGTIDGNLVNPI